MDYLNAFSTYCDMREHQFSPEIPMSDLPKAVREQKFSDNLKLSKFNFEKDLDKEIDNIKTQAARESHVLIQDNIKQLRNIERDKLKQFHDKHQQFFNDNS